MFYPLFKVSPRMMIFLHRSMLVLGVAAITLLGLMFIKPELNYSFQAISPFFKQDITAQDPMLQEAGSAAASTATHTHDVTDQVNKQSAANSKQQHTVANWLSKRYRIAFDAAKVLVATTYHTAQELKLDPLLILSVIAIESGFNPLAESPVGAKGLMQVMAKVHQDKFDEVGGLKAALNPTANIWVGAQILKEYVNRGGSVEAGLKMYVGAAFAETDGGYGGKVLAEYKRLKQVAYGKTVPLTTVATAVVTTKTRISKVSEEVEPQTAEEELET